MAFVASHLQDLRLELSVSSRDEEPGRAKLHVEPVEAPEDLSAAALPVASATLPASLQDPAAPEVRTPAQDDGSQLSREYHLKDIHSRRWKHLESLYRAQTS